MHALNLGDQEEILDHVDGLQFQNPEGAEYDHGEKTDRTLKFS
jgi:hypothetical protein